MLWLLWSYVLTASKRIKLLLPATHFAMVLYFFSLAIHFRSRPRDISQPSLQNFRPRTDSFIWAVDKVFCISSSWFVVLPLLHIFFCNFLATTWIPCQLYSKFIVSCIVGALYTFNHLFSLFVFYFVCFSFSLFFLRFVHCFVSPFISVSFVPHLLRSGATLSVSPHAAVARRGKKGTWSAKLAQLCSTMLNSPFAPLFLRSSVKLLMRNLVFRINHSIIAFISLTCHLSQSWDPSN